MESVFPIWAWSKVMIKNKQKENIKDIISELSDLMQEMKIALEKIIRLLK